MSIKKKLGLGVAAAALGISLVGGGTWAAFNDIARINNHFAAGTLDLVISKNHSSHQLNFDLKNLKPGDNVQRIFKLENDGTLAIKEVLLNVTYSDFIDDTSAVNGGTNNAWDFLSQFVVDFIQVDTETSQWQPRGNVFKNGAVVTLADLVDGTYVNDVRPEYLSSDGRINLAALISGSDRAGLPVTPADTDAVMIQITFKNDLAKNPDGTYVQNKYQGDSINFYFNLEATQWEGRHVDTSNPNGTMNNDNPNATSPSNSSNKEFPGNEVED